MAFYIARYLSDLVLFFYAKLSFLQVILYNAITIICIILANE
ncbi:putative membrane protein [Piscirickettsia salmonis LF-89 = ATCC VR-1361]|nr:putative membrane protein [Piscirickettsia salmonis LF-89 = ATCC VR-1361]